MKLDKEEKAILKAYEEGRIELADPTSEELNEIAMTAGKPFVKTEG